jgi:pimeloyl-ACP methyl ester carboxylesterase
MDLDGTELREGYADVGDVSLHYVEAGEGPLIVLLHGFPEFWFGWRLQIKPLADAGFRVVAPDMRGYNLSSRPADVKAYDIDHLTADIRALVEERGAESAFVVGHDWGGKRRLGYRDEQPTDRGPDGHPQCCSSAEAVTGSAPPGPAPKVLVLLLLRPSEAARKRRAREQLALLPALSARRQPGIHA